MQQKTRILEPELKKKRKSEKSQQQLSMCHEKAPDSVYAATTSQYVAKPVPVPWVVGWWFGAKAGLKRFVVVHS